MAVNALVQDGKLTETAAQTSTKISQTPSPNNGYDKDAFLQLLVAQMKYQDPMEPTDNSQYITQYATFSQVEQMQNMAQSVDLSRASSMVGQTVQISSEDSSGNAQLVEGVVDYVKFENNKAFVVINGESYPSDSVTAVVDKSYYSALDAANTFAESIDRLPSLMNLSIGDKDTIAGLYELYSNMSDYEKGFLNESYAKLLDTYVERMKVLIENAAKAEQEKDKENDSDTSEEEAIGEVTASDTQNSVE
ncbi:MAG: hypothetical protein K6F53_10130 [Lachnospiraceae bacterium]|nr:hypothetical protein [Lachnospiraceae bacterium]